MMLSFKEYVSMTESMGAETRYWFNVKTKKLEKLREKYHDWAPVGRPERFGLKPDQVARFKKPMDRGDDIIPGVQALMAKQGYIKLSAARGEWNISAGSVPQAAAGATAMSKKHPTPPRLFLDVVGRAMISKMLVKGEIDDFIKTGKIIKRTEIGATMARFR